MIAVSYRLTSRDQDLHADTCDSASKRGESPPSVPVDAVGATVFLDGRILKFRDGFPNRLLLWSGVMNTPGDLITLHGPARRLRIGPVLPLTSGVTNKNDT